jgi:large subunit ribosomal protein L25
VSNFSLDAQPRQITGKKVSQLRNKGLVPATVYGPKTAPINVQVPYRALEVTLMKAGGTNLIDLTVDGTTHSVLTRAVQRDVLKRTILHVDFFAVDLTAKIRTEIPFHLVGESPVVAQKRGILITGANSVSVEILPSQLINFIEIDLSKLKNVGDTISIGDLQLGEGILIMDEPEEMIARIVQTSAARSEEELEDSIVTNVEPEVIHKGKQEEEDF